MLKLPLDIIISIIELHGVAGGCYRKLSLTCKLFNNVIKNPYSNGIHKNIIYKTNSSLFGSRNISWKQNIHGLDITSSYCPTPTSRSFGSFSAPFGASAGTSTALFELGNRDSTVGTTSQYNLACSRVIPKNIIIKFEMIYLKKIKIDGFALKIIDIFKTCKNLEKVSLKNCTVHTIKHIKEAISLTSLNLFNTAVVSFSGALPETIQKLDLRFASCSLLSLSVNTRLTKLKTKNCVLSINPLNSTILNHTQLTTFSVHEGDVRNSSGPMRVNNDSFMDNGCLSNFSVNSVTMGTSNIKILSPGVGMPRRTMNKLELINTDISDMGELKLYVSAIKKLYMKNNHVICFDFTREYSESLEHIVICNSLTYNTSFIENLHNLKKIDLKGPIDIDINVFKNPEKIKSLHLYAFNITNSNMLFKFLNLKHLYINTHNIQNIHETILSISRCTLLKTLGFNIRGIDGHAVDYLLWPIATLPLLEKLDITNLGITDISYIPISIQICSLYKQKKEYYLYPGHCNISFYH